MKVIGYIVENENYGAMECSNGQLYFRGNHATMFSSRRKAKKAIDATTAERKRTFDRDFEQEFGQLRITRIKSESEK